MPHRNGIVDETGREHSGNVVRIDTFDFTLHGVSVFNTATAPRGQVPNIPDNDLRGFSGGFASGKYGFFVPYFNGANFSSKLGRISLDNWEEIQLMDLQQVLPELRGFSAGFFSVDGQPLDISLFNDYEVLPGTKTAYQFVY